jgi:SPFH domain / Band 7 family
MDYPPCYVVCPNPYKPVSQVNVGLVTKLRKFSRAVEPGLVKVNPPSERLIQVDVKIQIVKVPRQVCITKGSVTLSLTYVSYYPIVSPHKAAFGISNIRQALIEHTQNTLRHVVGARVLQAGSGSSQPAFDLRDRDSGIILQPKTRSITQEQLVNEVKDIYAGLVMVKNICVEIDQQLAATPTKLSNEQVQALIAPHRTLLHEQHDFFLVSLHQSASPTLRRLATKYAMPARMWRHGIHSFLEIVRHRLPESLDHILSFIYLARSMMAVLMESVPSLEETWIECLGDLARYRMAIEDENLHDCEVWSEVARTWYDLAATKSPGVERIQHHLPAVARPNIIEQLFYYINHKFRVLRPETATVLFADIFGFGDDLEARSSLSLKESIRQRAPSWSDCQNFDFPEEFAAWRDAMRSYYVKNLCVDISPQDDVQIAASQVRQMLMPTRPSFLAPHDMHDHRFRLFWASIAARAARSTDEQIVSFMHVILAFQWSLTFTPSTLQRVEAYLPWDKLVSFLNTLAMPGTVEGLAGEFPKPKRGSGRQIPEDFTMRGLIWSPSYFPDGFFSQSPVHEDETSSRLRSYHSYFSRASLWVSSRFKSAICSSRKGEDKPLVFPEMIEGAGIPSQNSTAHPRQGRSGQCVSTDRNTISRRSDNGILKLWDLSRIVLQLAPTYLALSWIPVALAQEDLDISQTSTGPSWITEIYLAVAAGLLGHLTKENPLQASGVSAYMFIVIAFVWERLEPATKFFAVVLGLSPLLAVGLGQLWKKWRENAFRQQDCHRMEEGDLDAQDKDDDYESFHWTGEPRYAIGSIESSENSIGEASGIDRYEDRDSSPEPWNGTEGFQR